MDEYNWKHTISCKLRRLPMRIQGKKLTALLLAFCIVLGLAACGSGGDDKNADTDQLSGTIYVPSFIDMELEAEYINSDC